MIRFTKAFALAAALLVLPSIASAIGLNVVGSSAGPGSGGSALLDYGETITFDLVIDWTGLTPGVSGAEAQVTNYDLPDASFTRDFGLALAGGSSAEVLLGNYANIPSVGLTELTPGLANSNGSAPSGPVENYVINNLNPVAYTTSLFGGISVAPVNGDGSTDLGIGGGLMSPGDLHFQVTFQNVLPSSYAGPDLTTTLNFDLLLLDGSGGTIATTGDTFTLTMVPEPGTALLMGLGLAGLATTRRR